MVTNAQQWGRRAAFFGLMIIGLVGCQDPKPTTPPAETTPVETASAEPARPAPEFVVDSAYAFLKKQVDFGPRVPNTEPHRTTAKWLANEFRRFDLQTLVQEGTVEAYNGDSLEIYNIIGRYRPEAKPRVMLFAHWDTRPYADRDTKRKAFPIDGANDGASGVAVILEIARLLQQDSLGPHIGIDFILFDAEDYGQPQNAMQSEGQSQNGRTWCLGTQYWAKNPPIPNYRPRYGILLDMVGGKDAIFPKEGLSRYYAPHVVRKVWDTAQKLGYGKYFVNQEGPELTDDHRFVNSMASIPSIDIVHYDPRVNDFGPFHHRHIDNLDIIDTNVLQAVGHTLMEVLYAEK